MVTFQTYFHLGVKVWLKNDNLGPKRPDKIFIREYKIPSYLTYFDPCRAHHSNEACTAKSSNVYKTLNTHASPIHYHVKWYNCTC